jgi:ubiquitin-conjugating enzyme E2 M
MEFPDPDDIMNFTVTLKPDEGFWKGGKFTFKFEIPADYPHSPPKTVSASSPCTIRHRSAA